MLLTKRHYLMMGVALVLAAALTVSAATVWGASDPVTVPQHTAINVRLDQAVATNRSRAGDHFEATVSQPVVVDGKTVIPKGAHAEGLVVDSRQSGRLKGRARSQLALQTVDVDGQNYNVPTLSHPRIGRDDKTRHWSWTSAIAA